MEPTRLILASASPRRRALVSLLGLPWRTLATDIDEHEFLVSEPLLSALNVAAAKARALAMAAHELVVAADTLVVADGQTLGKPVDAVDARGMLTRLRGRAHAVLTGVVVRAPDERVWGGVVSTRVTMRDYKADELERYLERGESYDKAGGYAVQDRAFAPVARVDGCYLNVVGLPLCAVAAGLSALSVRVPNPDGQPAPCGYCRAGEALVAIG